MKRLDVLAIVLYAVLLTLYTVSVFRDLSTSPADAGLASTGETPGGATPEATGRASEAARPVAHPRASRARRGQVLDVTAYCYTGHRTASGKWPQAGMAAGNAWPFGTRLDVQGVGVVVVQDRIGHGTDLDLYISSCQDAVRFGRRHLLVTVTP